VPAETVAALYKNRWQIEPFFRWIEQRLRIKPLHRNFAQCSEDSSLERGER
jgi:IS4 transposase